MPTHIHPTAIIDPSAQIGNDVHVGPYCIIGAGVELGVYGSFQRATLFAGYAHMNSEVLASNTAGESQLSAP